MEFREFKGTTEEFERFVEGMKSEGLVVELHRMIPLGLEGKEFEFMVIQLLAIFRLSKELANRLNMSVEEVESSFISAACNESCSMSQEQKIEFVSRYYGCWS
ncbi:hypothetical protein [Oscillatoria acuminata]|uniref:Uncharacterized protein n=1 Tax=Oscillatoria acuminata PCC 6304 TaxID=56110 RepID=K9TFQ7_9CYAN|nr:hypothetical protein [Oscillatoria acuminata]AFY81238.1 hypothetical protein Oscil6304_1533 [Oscillatoria acuminata PCC 6304]